MDGGSLKGIQGSSKSDSKEEGRKYYVEQNAEETTDM